MANSLELDRHRGLRKGFLVQRANTNGVADPEGVLVAIHRSSLEKRFNYSVDWQDGNVPEELSPQKIVRSNFGDFPHWEDEAVKGQTWHAGDSHFWIRFHREGPDGGSCLFCGRMRGLMAANNLDSCSGPVRIELR